ncbi:hypothetical protein N7478_007486 [Penicillium angulare]|uniref:uncharacterized protein n=1 Tax=Penicillium angulare TaxID=116970 RepID=UPI0025421295|nr:uncharacterized protein N7478_007486 [Penicillium angulare]KAJ5272361.1 hypothetical protein N7478_007486 [Penicillium angulare]
MPKTLYTALDETSMAAYAKLPEPEANLSAHGTCAQGTEVPDDYTERESFELLEELYDREEF